MENIYEINPCFCKILNFFGANISDRMKNLSGILMEKSDGNSVGNTDRFFPREISWYFRPNFHSVGNFSRRAFFRGFSQLDIPFDITFLIDFVQFPRKVRWWTLIFLAVLVVAESVVFSPLAAVGVSHCDHKPFNWTCPHQLFDGTCLSHFIRSLSL